MADETPCPSGAHFRGGCKCIGWRGLRHRDEDKKLGIERDWGWYLEIYRDDPPDTPHALEVRVKRAELEQAAVRWSAAAARDNDGADDDDGLIDSLTALQEAADAYAKETAREDH